jgi:hypothetical protein
MTMTAKQIIDVLKEVSPNTQVYLYYDGERIDIHEDHFDEDMLELDGILDINVEM